jgi:hypothetical protein
VWRSHILFQKHKCILKMIYIHFKIFCYYLWDIQSVIDKSDSVRWGMEVMPGNVWIFQILVEYDISLRMTTIKFFFIVKIFFIYSENLNIQDIHQIKIRITTIKFFFVVELFFKMIMTCLFIADFSSFSSKQQCSNK